jgi:hypothetical protein
MPARCATTSIVPSSGRDAGVATADAQFSWLNRVQCVGIGRVDMKARRVEFDIYVVRVVDRATPTNNN